MSTEIQSDGPLLKKPRTEGKKKKTKELRPTQCEFYMVQKRRHCAMMKKKDSQFCADHSVFLAKPKQDEENEYNDRIPCPLDPKHSVKIAELEQHMKKCNAKPAETHEPWYVKDLNASLNGENDDLEKVLKNEDFENSTVEIEGETFKNLFQVLEAYSCKMAPLESKVQTHPGLESWYLQKGSKKHVTQQDSLIGALKESELLSTEKFYVEFGCGRAELSRMVNACIVHDFKTSEDTIDVNFYGFGLVDRGKNRMKMDSKITSDCAGTPISPQIKRSRIDIQHLDLDTFLESENHKSVVAISKHLCGVATDLTLKSILNSKKSRNLLDGMVVAMCCRHVCDYQQLLPQSRAYLTENGILNHEDFSVLKRIVTWAVCGRMEGHDGDNHLTGLTYDERERLGLIARRMIDESRKIAINELLKEHEAELFIYAEKDTTLENHCLRIKRREV